MTDQPIALPATTSTGTTAEKTAAPASMRTASEWAALKAEFATWLMDPFRGTQRDWAEARGVHEQRLSEWKSEPEFVKLLEDWRGRAKVAIPDMLQAVIKRVKETGDPHAFRAVMEALGESKQEIDVKVSEPFLKLQEKLVAIRAAALEAERQQPTPLN